MRANKVDWLKTASCTQPTAHAHQQLPWEPGTAWSDHSGPSPTSPSLIPKGFSVLMSTTYEIDHCTAFGPCSTH